MKKHEYLECGKIANTHGVKGNVKVMSWCDSPDVLASLKYVYMKEKGEYVKYTVAHASLQKNMVLMSFTAFSTVEEVIPLKGRILYAKREDIASDDTYFVAELIGTKVCDATDGREYGTLKDITNLGASDIYVIDTPNGEVMIPAVDEFVKGIDDENDVILISPIPGMFDDNV